MVLNWKKKVRWIQYIKLGNKKVINSLWQKLCIFDEEGIEFLKKQIKLMKF